MTTTSEDAFQVQRAANCEHIFPDLAEHQKKAIAKMKDGCILWGGVGSGKSRVGLAYYVLTEAHEDVYVITTAKKRDSLDWQEEALKFGIGRTREGTLHGTITVDSWNNIHKYTEVKNAFFIFDEQRLVGSGKWSKSFLKIAKSNRWIMLSATPGDTWMDYIPVFVANGFYRNRTEFKREHVIYNTFTKFPKVERYVGVGRLIKHRNSLLVHMPYERQTVRHTHTVWCEYDEIAMARVGTGRWNVFEDQPIRDVSELYHVMRLVANLDPSRIVAVERLLKKHPRLPLFYNFDPELYLLRELGERVSAQGVTVAEWNGHKHEEVPDSERWLYLVQYAAGSEAWNCVSTDATCFYSLPYSYKFWEQAHGRIDRLNTEFVDLNYYNLRSKATIDWKIWRSLKAKKSFQFEDFDMSNSEFADFNASIKEAA